MRKFFFHGENFLKLSSIIALEPQKHKFDLKDQYIIRFHLHESQRWTELVL